jgi:glycosyltransferase involved in cell wall biosynthesis
VQTPEDLRALHVSGEQRQLPALPAEPLVSVLMVNYNYGHFIGEAIESVLAQTYRHFELIICDDGSTDNSREVISSYAARDKRIKTIFKANGRVAAALNATYRASTGAIITMLDADDLFLPHKIERVVQRLAAGGRVGMVFNILTKIDGEGREVGRAPEFGAFDRGELRQHVLQSAAHWSVGPTSAISFRRECADIVFPIPEQQFKTEADAYMCTVAPLFYAVDVIEEPVTLLRIHSSNLTSTTTMDVAFCEKIMNAGERVFSVLSTVAAHHGWDVTKLEHNPTYCEMRLIRDYLAGAGSTAIARDIEELRAAAGRVKTADRRKTRAKATLLSLAAMLPQRLGRPIIDSIYLPSKSKRLASNLVRKGRGALRSDRRAGAVERTTASSAA